MSDPEMERSAISSPHYRAPTCTFNDCYGPVQAGRKAGCQDPVFRRQPPALVSPSGAAQDRFVHDFTSAWNKAMILDCCDLVQVWQAGT